MSDFESVNPLDCCGNGCVNCILYAPAKRIVPKLKDNKLNLLEEWRKYELIEFLEIIPNIFRLKFEFIGNSSIKSKFTLDVPLGHHLMMRAPLEGEADIISNETHLLRPYTPFWVDADELKFMILINLKINGKMSKIIKSMKISNELEFKIFNNSFDYMPNKYKNLVMLCHGVAISPIMRIINEILSNDEDDTIIHSFSCFTNLNSVIFRQQMHEYKNYWNFNNKIYLSREFCEECNEFLNNKTVCEHFIKKLKYKEKIYPGRLDREEMEGIFNVISRESLGIVVCGYKTFTDFVTDFLKDFGIIEGVLVL